MRHGVPHQLSRWLYLLVLVAGAINVFAFSPFEFYPLVFITPAILFYALSKAQTKKQYFKLSWIFGIGLFGAGASWPFYSLYFFAHAPLIVSIIATTLFVIIIALLSMGLFGLLAAQFRATPLFLRLLLFYPASWVFMEWLRSWLLTGFPWLYFGNSLIDSVFSSYAPIVGVLGVSFIAVLIAGALLSFVLGNSVLRTVYLEHDPDNQMVSDKAVVEEYFGTKVRIFSALLIALLSFIGMFLQDVNWTNKTGRVLTVSVLQSNISQLQKLDPNQLDFALDRYVKMTKEAQKKYKSDIIVWPETGLFDVFNKHMDTLILPLQETIRDNQSILIGGFFLNSASTVENSVLALSSDDRLIYSKRHLVPFGEYIPMLEYIRWMGDWIPYSNITAGKNNGLLSVSGELAQMSICYEGAFGSEVIESLPEATLLINVTHDGWFTGSLQPEQHMQIARMRSLETGRYMIRATTTGPAGIIDEKGQVVTTAPHYTQQIITGKVYPFTGSTPYVRWGNWFIIGLMSIILLTGLIVNLRKKLK